MTHVNGRWVVDPFNMTWGYQIYIPKCLFSHRDDLPENFVKITPQKCKTSTSGWHALLKSVLALTPFNVTVKQPCCPWNVAKWVISTYCLLNRTPSGFITPELIGICSCSRKSSSLQNGRKVAILVKHLWWWASSGKCLMIICLFKWCLVYIFSWTFT